MADQKKMKVGMVGVGGFGGYRRDRMRESGLFEIVAAYDLNKEVLADAEKRDGAKPVASYEALLKTPGIEAMVVSTGGKFHAPQALAAMDKGLHVFVEKPLCSTKEETLALLAMQKKTGLVVGLGHNDHRNNHVNKAIKQMVDSGELGTVATFEKTTAHSGGLEIKPGDWRGDPDKNPGGMLFQCGVHALHELMYYFGAIKRVACMMRYDVHTTQTADVAHCILHFESGLIGTLSAYHVTPYHHSFNIYGTKKNIYIDGRAPSYGDPTYMATQERKNCLAEMHVPLIIPESQDPQAELLGNIRSFYNAVRTGAKNYPNLEDGARAVMVVFAAEEAAKTGKTVDVPWLL